MDDEARPPRDYGGLDQPIGMGGHFMKVFGEDEWLNLRLLPFILVWVAFVVVLLVRIYSNIAKSSPS
jgi:hypothetical protein